MNKLNVSVVIPCYNAAPFLRETLDSALAQTHPPLEVIVVDDGSTDDSAAIAESFGRPVRVIRQHSQGAAVARHVGVEAAKSNIIAFQDADDIAAPHKVEVLLHALVTNRECVVSFGLTQDYESGNVIASFDPEKRIDGRFELASDPLGWLLGRSAPITGAMNLLTHRTAALKVTTGRPFYKVANDYALQLRLAGEGPFIFVASVTTIQRRTKGLTHLHGAARQKAFAIIAGDELMRSARWLSKRYKKTWQDRVEHEWPAVALGLSECGDLQLLSRIVYIAMLNADLRSAPRRFWWALDETTENVWSNCGWWRKTAVNLLRGFRQAVLQK